MKPTTAYVLFSGIGLSLLAIFMLLPDTRAAKIFTIVVTVVLGLVMFFMPLDHRKK